MMSGSGDNGPMGVDGIEELIGRVSLGDRAAFRQLYDRTNAKLFGVCLRILRDRTEAEETLQEVYVKIWQRSDRYSSARAGAFGWLAAIARNHAIDRMRARRPDSGQMSEASEVADERPNPETRAVLSSEGRRIAACMDELDADRSEAVRRAYVEGLSYDELASHYGVPLNTMRTWLRRSLIRLRECLER